MKGRIRSFVSEMRNRGVFRAIGAYTVVCWMLLQVADVTFDRLPIPGSSMTVLIALVIAGYPIAFILAWAYEITTNGIVRHNAASGRAPRLSFVPFISLVVLVTIGSGFGLYYLSQDHWIQSRRSIAILPFSNMSESADAEYFSDGLTEDIRSMIIRLNEFRVVALSTSYRFKDTFTDVVSIAERLGAEVILQGSVRRYKNQVSVTARLIDGSDGLELWSETYDRQLSDLLPIQKDIARQVARALHVVLPVSAERRLRNLGTKNIEAYDLYLRGTDYLRKPADQTTLTIAEGFIRQAMVLDPDFASAVATMCEIHLARYRLSRDTNHFANAETACQKALDQGKDFSEVHLALAGLYQASGDYAAALLEYESTLELNQNSTDAYIGLGQTYVQLDRNAEAETSLRRAIDLDVSYWASFNAMGNFLFDQGRFLEAAEFYKMFVGRADDDSRALSNLGAAYYLAGDFSEAAKAWEKSLAIKPTRSAYSNTGSMYFYLGQYEKAADRYAQAVNLSPNDYVLWGNLADAYYFSADMQQVADVAYRRAIEFAEGRLSVNSSDIDALSGAAYFYSRIGEKEKSVTRNDEALAAAPDNMYVHYNSALIHAHFGNQQDAIAALEKAVSLEYQRDLLLTDPGFNSLQENPGFQRLVSGDEK
jgi:TolB-like protein/Tfp pilus assembly protein PilF